MDYYYYYYVAYSTFSISISISRDKGATQWQLELLQVFETISLLIQKASSVPHSRLRSNNDTCDFNDPPTLITQRRLNTWDSQLVSEN